MTRTPITWLEAEPARAAAEQAAMARPEGAPNMSWVDPRPGFPAGGFEGEAPQWPFGRPEPKGLPKLTEGKRLRLKVVFEQGHPGLPPRLFALDPEPRPEERLLERFHVNGDGTLCMILHRTDWSTRSLAVELVQKASGWFIEYLAVHRGLIEEMSRFGLFECTDLDQILEEL